jgi:hypothetical protein
MFKKRIFVVFYFVHAAMLDVMSNFLKVLQSFLSSTSNRAKIPGIDGTFFFRLYPYNYQRSAPLTEFSKWTILNLICFEKC